MYKKTKIVATIGPKSEDVKILEKLFRAGVNVCRQNFSHGDFEEHGRRFENIQKAAKQSDMTIATLQDLSGPKIRTGENKDGEWLSLKKGQKIFLTDKKSENTNESIYINYAKLIEEVKPGDRVLLNDGKVTLQVTTKKDRYTLQALVKNNAKIRSRRGVNFPDSDISVSSLTAKDKKDLLFGLKLGFDFVALSFVRTAKDIKDLKRILKKHQSEAKVVAKIETPQAVQNIDEILQESDAVMVARGDLAVEVGAQRVPIIQKRIIKKANALGKPVIVATQMLDSMINEPTPTRAEVSDVSNAILDGADAVMLSEETAMGSYPLETVKVMSQIAVETEMFMNYEKRAERDYTRQSGKLSKTDVITRYAAKAALDLGAKAIVSFTETGTTAKMIARFRTKQPVLVISPSDKVIKQSILSFNVYAGLKTNLSRKRDVIKLAKKLAFERSIAKKGEYIVVVSGSIFGVPGETNTVTIVEV